MDLGAEVRDGRKQLPPLAGATGGHEFLALVAYGRALAGTGKEG